MGKVNWIVILGPGRTIETHIRDIHISMKKPLMSSWIEGGSAIVIEEGSKRWWAELDRSTNLSTTEHQSGYKYMDMEKGSPILVQPSTL